MKAAADEATQAREDQLQTAAVSFSCCLSLNTPWRFTVCQCRENDTLSLPKHTLQGLIILQVFVSLRNLRG